MTKTTVPCPVPCLSLVSLRLAKRAKGPLLTKGQGHPKGHHQGTPQINCGTAILSEVSLVSLGFRKKHSGGTFARGEPPGHCKSPDSLYEEMKGQRHHQGTPLQSRFSRPMRRNQPLTTITDSGVISTLCSIQQQFVATWNKNEEDWTHPEDDHALPNGAEYSGSIHPAAGGKIGASFSLTGKDTWVCLLAKRSWKHWHEGWSFKRNSLDVDDVRKVVVIGSADEFQRWFQKAAVSCN